MVFQFYDDQDELIQRYTGEIFRPPIIRLVARLIRIRFNGNGGTGTGYRAIIRYLSQNATEEVVVNTHCGGLVDTFGGAITMMNMTNSSATIYDCIWLIKPQNNYLHLKTHLLVRIDTFENMGKEILFFINPNLLFCVRFRNFFFHSIIVSQLRTESIQMKIKLIII